MEPHPAVKAFCELLQLYKCPNSSIDLHGLRSFVLFLSEIKELSHLGLNPQTVVRSKHEEEIVLKILLNGMQEFLLQKADCELSSESVKAMTSKITLVQMQDSQSSQSLLFLIQLTIRVALLCSQKEKFIASVLTLPESSQAALMDLLQYTPQSSSIIDQTAETGEMNSSYYNGLVKQLSDMENEKDRMLQEIQTLNASLCQVAAELEESNLRKEKLKKQNDSLMNSVSELESRLEEMDNINRAQVKILRRQWQHKIQSMEKQCARKCEEATEMNKIKCKNYEDRIQLIETKVKRKQKRIQELIKFNEQLSLKMEDSKEVYSRTQSEISQLNSILRTQERNIGQLQNQKQILMTELDSTRNKLEDMTLMITAESKLSGTGSSSGGFHKLGWGDCSRDSGTLSVNSAQHNNSINHELKAKYEVLKEQVGRLKKLQTKNRDLKYENKKLLRTLREYELYRGQQNEIVLGCIYELQKKINRNSEVIFP